QITFGQHGQWRIDITRTLEHERAGLDLEGSRADEFECTVFDLELAAQWQTVAGAEHLQRPLRSKDAAPEPGCAMPVSEQRVEGAPDTPMAVLLEKGRRACSADVYVLQRRDQPAAARTAMQMHCHGLAVLVRKRFVSFINDGFAVQIAKRGVTLARQW
ncbi:hypothetical protein NCPPB3923_26750, partial [Burkholderia glumae]